LRLPATGLLCGGRQQHRVSLNVRGTSVYRMHLWNRQYGTQRASSECQLPGGGIDEGRSARDPSATRRRKRRGSDSHLRHVLDGTVVIAAAPERSRSGVSRRESYQRPRPRKLTIEERDAIRSEANRERSLRSVAGAFGVSHETIRAVLRDRRTNARVVNREPQEGNADLAPRSAVSQRESDYG
jgi:hypothetical protein